MFIISRKSSSKQPERKSLKLEPESKPEKKTKKSPKTPKAESSKKKTASPKSEPSIKKAESPKTEPAVKIELPENKPQNGQSKDNETQKDDGKVIKIQTAGAGQAGADYNPGKKNYNAIDDAFWGHGEK